MTPSVESLIRAHARGSISRRSLLLTLPALAMAPWARRAMAQSAPTIPVHSLNHTTLTVSDPKRSLDFYQGLFGMPVQARQGDVVCLSIGDGPQFLAISGGPDATPSIDHFCVSVDDFDVDRILESLARHGVSSSDDPAAGGGLSGGAMRVRVRMRGESAGGDPAGTPEIYVGDPDGTVVQIQDASYCGGAGVLGHICRTVETSPVKGVFQARDVSHFTIRSSDAQRANSFYASLFGLPVQVMQGGTPALGIGSGVQFVMFTGGAGTPGPGGGPPRPAGIDHVCLSVDGFDVDRILKGLEGFGVKPRGAATDRVGPMTSYVSMRMPNRGGAPGGTPEVYFTDPDGLRIQLQDARYCGGGGYLGSACPDA